MVYLQHTQALSVALLIGVFAPPSLQEWAPDYVSDLLCNLGRACGKVGRHAQALEHLKKSLETARYV
jgi:hypothetical protein